MRTTNCPEDEADDFQTVLIHEMTGVLGYSDGIENKVPVNCVTYRVAGAPINTSPCQHELEYIYAAYGYLTINVNTFWSTPIVTGFVNLPTSVTLVQGDSQVVMATGLHFARQLTPNAPLGSVSITWSSDDENVVQKPPAGASSKLKALNVGTTTVRAKIASGLSSSYLRGAVLTWAGHEITVTVTAPPPPPPGPFKVTDITGLTPPATEAGTYPLTATVANQPTGTLKIRWQVTYSNGVLGPLDSGYGPNGYALQVPAGSYSIRVTATPRSYQGANYFQGTAQIRDYPVCTEGGGGGGNYVAYQTGGEETPDVVGGC